MRLTDNSDLRIVGVLAVLLLLAATTSAHVSAQEKEWCGEIRSNTTWAPGTVHRVCSDGVSVQRSTLTVAPGADILMDDGANIVIEAGATFTAVGSEDAGIRFRANTRNEAPGFWGQIRFEEGAEPSTMARIEIRHGGKGGVPMIEVHSDEVLMNLLLLRGAEYVPLAFSADSLGPSLDVAGNVTQGQACRNIVIRENNVDGILVLADAAVDVVVSQVWHNFCVPYLVSEDITIGGETNPELRLDVGVQMQLVGDGAITAGVDAENPGQLLIDGTPSEPVSLSAYENIPGGWVGINLTEFSGFSGLNNVSIEQGGKGDRPMVMVHSNTATSIGTSYHGALGYPLSLPPAAVGPYLSGVFLEGEDVESVFQDNGIQRVLVLSSEQPVMSDGALWGNAGVPLEMDDDLILAGSGMPKLILDAGAKLAFRPGKRFIVGHEEHGSAEIEVVGEPEKPVVFTGTKAEPGAWAGLVIDERTATARFDYAVFEYGGGQNTPMVEWERVEGDIARSIFRGAVTYPISIPVSVAADVILDPDVSNPEGSDDYRSTFENNGVNRVLVNADRTVRATLTTWNDPGTVVEIDGEVGVSSTSTAVLVVNPGISMMFRPDSGLRLGNGERGRGSISISPAPDAKVKMSAVDGEKGWSGISVLKGSSVDAGGSLEMSGIADDKSAFSVDEGALVLRDVDLMGAKRGTGVIVLDDGSADIQDSRIKDFRIGLRVEDGGELDIKRCIVHGHSEWAIQHETTDAPCVTAELVYWGSPNGPKDESPAIDGCINNTNASNAGDKVTDFVNWWPYAVDTSFTPSTGLGPNPKKVYLPYMIKGQ